MADSQNRVQWVYSSKNNQELEDRYNQWAADYDRDLDEDFGWVSPRITAGILAGHVARDAKILDAGAGTGLVGEELGRLGYQDIHAMDLSLGMLEVARGKGVYRDFQQMALGNELGYETDFFDAVISVGVFTEGHAPPRSFDELVRVTRQDGFIVFSLRVDLYEEGGFKEYQAAMEERGRWKLAELSDPFQPLPKGEPEMLHKVWVYQVTS
ncbi:MAG: class I SAM-dependent methyltransferase [Chloroflexota bacterium]|nr:class I SAM-dependent methyltransferase [Chloroflexota bacterium]